MRERLSQPAPRLERVHYNAEDSVFERPETLDECFAIAAAHPEARWISGATDMGVESNLRFRRWPRLVSLEAVAELREFFETGDGISHWRFGAAVASAQCIRAGGGGWWAAYGSVGGVFHRLSADGARARRIADGD